MDDLLDDKIKSVMKTEGRLTFLQYLNTIILTIVAIFAGILFGMLKDINNNQTEFAKELLRLKTIQDINVANVKSITERITTLELNYLDYIKTWVDQNYVRKPQK